MEQLGKTDLQLNDHMTGTGIPAPVFLVRCGAAGVEAGRWGWATGLLVAGWDGSGWRMGRLGYRPAAHYLFDIW